MCTCQGGGPAAAFGRTRPKSGMSLFPGLLIHLLASRIVLSRGLGKEDFARGRAARAPSTLPSQLLLDGKLLCAFTTDQHEAHFAQVHNMSEAVLTMVHRFQDFCKA